MPQAEPGPWAPCSPAFHLTSLRQTHLLLLHKEYGVHCIYCNCMHPFRACQLPASSPAISARQLCLTRVTPYILSFSLLLELRGLDAMFDLTALAGSLLPCQCLHHQSFR